MLGVIVIAVVRTFVSLTVAKSWAHSNCHSVWFCFSILYSHWYCC